MKRLITICATFCFVAFATNSTALAVLTYVGYQDDPRPDPLLFVPSEVHELGLFPDFPPEEEISAYAEPTTLTSWSVSDVPFLPNALVYMLNLTGRDWSDVWYVADAGTDLTNYEGWINGLPAFKIDRSGLNTPLVYEDNPNGIFEAGEQWQFIIQDYDNQLGNSPSNFVGRGVPSADPWASGSIIAVPEPATIALLGLGALSLLRRKRKT